MSHKQVTCITFLKLAAASDIKDYLHSLNVFHPGLSFRLQLSLSLIKSYLLNLSFNIIIENSSEFQFLYRVTQGSVLGPLIFILHITSLSTVIVISNSAANYNLYADDTQHSYHSQL